MKDKIKSLPETAGVYLFKNQNGDIIYVGKAKSLRKRVFSYFKKGNDLKTAILLTRLYDLDWILTASEMDALILENKLIKKYQPRYNIVLKDDKTYPYIKITIKEEWPRVFMVRRKESDGARYFGPYRGGMVKTILGLIKKTYPVRWCKEVTLKPRTQPCLFGRIGSCAAPCLQQISHAAYRQLIQSIILLLEGKSDKAIVKLNDEMKKAAQEQNYERAGMLRDRVEQLEKLLEAKDLERPAGGQRVSVLNDLQKALGLSKIPMRIEAFDVSNIQGSNMVGSMVVFQGGIPLKRDYRRFNLKTVGPDPNDAAAIYEIVKRRYSNSLTKKLPWPDLILIDGGKPQLGAALKALSVANRLDLPLISLAKREEEIFMPNKRNSLVLEKHSAALMLLQRIRDEAHRFAITFHRQKRSQRLFM
ncbi:MAG: excinuclease ABC subunit UvrC [Candidatus Margulisiibacteriota bacterium]